MTRTIFQPNIVPVIICCFVLIVLALLSLPIAVRYIQLQTWHAAEQKIPHYRNIQTDQLSEHLQLFNAKSYVEYTFVTADKNEEIYTYYRKALAASGWTLTEQSSLPVVCKPLPAMYATNELILKENCSAYEYTIFAQKVINRQVFNLVYDGDDRGTKGVSKQTILLTVLN